MEPCLILQLPPSPAPRRAATLVLPTPNTRISAATRRTEATGLGTAVMFAGVLLIPPGFGVAVAASGSYMLAYTTLAVLALASAVLLCLPHADTAPQEPDRG